MSQLVYLASPYSHPLATVRQVRFETISRIAGELMARKGLLIFSPIAHTHPILVHSIGVLDPKEITFGWDWWKKYDEAILSRCDRFVIVPLDGWMDSKGIKGEIEIWKSLDKGVVEILDLATLAAKPLRQFPL